MNILFLVNELLTVCGVSKHLYHLLHGLQEIYPNNNYYVICGGGDAIEKFRKLDIPISIHKNLKHETRSIKGYLSEIYEIKKFVKNFKIDIIHSHHHYAASIAQKVSVLTNSKTILTNHGILPEKGLLSHFSAQHIIAVNEHVKNYIYKKRIKQEKEVSLIYCGLPLPKKEKSIGDKIRILSGGRLVEDKGFDSYIQAVSILDKNIKNKAKFLLAGIGEEESTLKKLNNNLNANIKFLGKIDDFQTLLLNTDIFVVPTRSTSEGFPTVIIEAGLAKNLLITTNFKGLGKTLSKEEAIIVEIDNIKQLSENIKYAIENYHLLNKKIRKLNELVLRKFNYYNMIHQTFNLYKSILMK